MIKKSKLSILLTTIILLVSFIPKTNAAQIYLKNGNTMNVGAVSTTTNEIAYDIESLIFHMEDTPYIEVNGWATLHGENNWSGVYSIISIGVAKENEIPSVFYEVTNYTNKNFFGWHCEPDGSGPCQTWKKQTSNGALAYYESQVQKCNQNHNYGCLYRDVGFNTVISIGNIEENATYYFYIMVTATDTKNLNNSNLITGDKDTNVVSRPSASDNYLIYNTNLATTSRIIKFGVDSESCSIISNNGSTKCDTTKETNIINNGYEITVGESSSKVTRVVDPEVYPQKQQSNGRYCSTPSSVQFTANTVEIDNIQKDVRRYGGTNCSTPQWPAQSIQKMYKLKNAGVMSNYWAPASWVVPEKNISFKLAPAKTCNPLAKTANLTCNRPGENFEIEFDPPNQECEQTFKTSSGRVIVKFTQHGSLNIGLTDKKIKSGMGFGFEVNYENIVTWEIEEPGFVTSDSLNNSQRQNEIEKLRQEINKYYTESELFTKSNAKFTFCGTGVPTLNYEYNCTNERDLGSNIGNRWKRPQADELISSDITGNIINDVKKGAGLSGTKTVTAKYELPNAWSSLDNIWNSTQKNTENNPAHVYSNTSPGDGYTDNGKVFYTYLDDDEGYHNISGYVVGLSTLAYENYKEYGDNEYIWQATYNCGVECFQEFYRNGPNTPLGTNSKGFNLSYREISHLEPFPIRKGATDINNLKKYYKGIDENWIIWANIIGSKELGKTNKQEAQQSGMDRIINRIGSTYTNEPEYTITVPKQAVKALKSLEKNRYANYITDFGYIKDNNGKYAYSSFLETEAGNMGIEVNRNPNNIVNEVGTCGEKRAETASTATCFCPLADSDGNCVYDGNSEGAGW